MNKRMILVFITFISMGLFATALGNQSINGDEIVPGSPDISGIVIASFERNLNHQATSLAKTQRNSIDNDILYQELNSVLWTDSTKLD